MKVSQKHIISEKVGSSHPAQGIFSRGSRCLRAVCWLVCWRQFSCSVLTVRDAERMAEGTRFERVGADCL